MPCNLTADRQVLMMTDLAGEQYELYYDLPTNPQRVAFSNSLYIQKGKKKIAKENIYQEKVAFGKKLCRGFSEGYFMDGDKFISSDPAKPYYREDWKELIARARPSDFFHLANAALSPATVGNGEEELAPAGEDDEHGPSEDAGTGGDDEAAAEALAKAEAAPLGSNSEPS
jgi:hypothetical protein